MNLYDLLRRMVEGRPFSDEQRIAALRLLTELEQDAALGEAAARPDHQCKPEGPWFPDSRVCVVCGNPIDPPAHACEAGWDAAKQSGEAGGSIIYALKCIVCGRGMTPAEIYDAR